MFGMGLLDFLNQRTGGLSKQDKKDMSYLADRNILADLGNDARRVAHSAAYGPEAVEEAYARFDANVEDALGKIKHKTVQGSINNLRTVTEHMAEDARNTQWIPDPRTGWTATTADPHSTFFTSQHRVETSLNALMEQANTYMNPNKNRWNANQFKPESYERPFFRDYYRVNTDGEASHHDPAQTQWNDDGTYRS
jgi:hypothetical protein